MPSPKANKRSPRRSTARPRKTDERLISVLGTLLEPSPWGRLSASDVTPEVAVRVSSIFAVCRFIAQGLGVMPVQIGRTLPNGRKERFSPPCGYTLRSRPNGWQSRFDFFTASPASSRASAGG
jgi:phage portal protein BeeE